MRDEFSKTIKRKLAGRCKYACSNPYCEAGLNKPGATIASHSDCEGVDIIGEACHIEAASEGGPRFNKNMTREERRAIDNGIWLCNVCSKIIDSEDDKYTVDILKRWKKDSEIEFNDERYIKNHKIVEKKYKLIAITNASGGTGKTFVTAMISKEIAEKTNRKILCLSTTCLDDLAYSLGINLKNNLNRVNITYEDDFCISIFKSSFFSNIDFIDSNQLINIMCYRYSVHGINNIEKFIDDFVEMYNYKYIICDCGRGFDSSLQKQLLHCSSDIIIPIGDNINAYRGTWTVCKLLKENKCSNIIILYSKGYLTKYKELNMKFRKMNLDLFDSLKKIKRINNKVYEARTVIPDNRYINELQLGCVNTFNSNKITNVVEAFRNFVEECRLYEYDNNLNKNGF
ncbi:ParA family protein [Clostridioides difficile]